MTEPVTEPVTVTDTVESPSRRTIGTAFVAIAAFGAVVSLVGTVVVWQFVGSLSRDTDRSLELAVDALVAIDATLDVADELVTSLDDGLAGVASTLEVVGATIEDTAQVASATAGVAAEVAPTLDRVDDALGSLSSISGAIDSTLRQLSRLPFGPSYDPDTSIVTVLDDLRDDLGPIGERLDAAAVELDGFAGTTGELRDEVDGLAADVDAIRTSLAGSAALVEVYRTTVADAAELADTTRGDLGDDLARTRLVIVLAGFALVLAQAVPLWLGLELRRGAPVLVAT